MEVLRNFANSAISCIREGFDEMVRFVNEFDTTKIADCLVEFNNDVREGIEKIKRHIQNLSDKFVVEVNYDRNCEVLSHSVEGNELYVRVVSDESCGCDTPSSVREFSTTIPEDVDVTTMKCVYDSVNNKMSFVFKKFNANNQEEQNENTETEHQVETSPQVENIVVSENEQDTEDNTNELSFEEKKLAMSLEMKALHDEGMSYRKIAKEFGVSDKTVARWIREIE